MDAMGKWFLEVVTAINGNGRLGPPAATKKRVSSFLEEVGGEGVLQISTLLKVGNAEATRKLAGIKPDLGVWLKDSQPQKALDSYFNSMANVFESFRNYATRGLSLSAGATAINFISPDSSVPGESEAWEKVFQVLFGR